MRRSLSARAALAPAGHANKALRVSGATMPRRSSMTGESGLGEGRQGVTRFVVGPDAALALAERDAAVPARHRLLAPTLLRSQVLAQLYGEVQRGRLTRQDAERRQDYLRRLPIRLLGDRVLQHTAWKIAEELGWPDTFVAEYLALTRLQADALVVRDAELAKIARSVVPVASFEDLLA